MKKFLPIIVFLLVSWGVQAQFVADFTSNKTFGCAPLIIKFTDASSLDANKWTWTSTAGTSSDIKNPTLIFATPGNFDVFLESTNGIETKRDTMSIRVSPGITVDFSSSASDGCIPFTAQLSDLSIPQSSAISSWFWSFTNGTTSTDQNPSVTFTKSGKYDVLLKIIDDNGCEATLNKRDFLVAGGPVADFNYDSMACSLPANVNFFNTSTGENLTYQWSFGNGNTSNSEIPLAQIYNAFDTVPVTLYVKENTTSCTDSVEKLMYIRNYPVKMEITAVCNALNYSLTLKDVTFPVPTSILWDLGDGSQSVKSEFTHNYAGNNPSIVTMTAKISESCTNTVTLNYGPPKAQFSSSAKSSCESPYVVDFINLSTGNGLSYFWEYGDTNLIDTVFENSHGYVVPPLQFQPKLSVVDTFGCTNTYNRLLEVPVPVAEFSTENEITSGCAPLTIDFVDLSKIISEPIKE
ncbi:MAG: PKD repeat protein, partial [Saprospiraceae bacterium]